MSYSSVTVCVAVPGGDAVPDAVAAALAPFEGVRWDRWQIDNADGPFGLPVRAGAETDPRVLRVSRRLPPDRCDGAPRGLVDFGPDRAAERRQAETDWARWHEVARRHPPGRPLVEYLRGGDAVQAWRDHREQPVLLAYQAVLGIDRPDFRWSESDDPIDRIGYDRDAFVRRRVACAIGPPELLRLDGVWIDAGSAGRDRYYLAADAYLETLPPDVYLVRVYVQA